MILYPSFLHNTSTLEIKAALCLLGSSAHLSHADAQ